MANSVKSGMVPELRMPTRTAPRPPNYVVQRNITWSNTNDPFGDSFNPQLIQKKKPPPRPPPPKFKVENSQNRKDQKPKKPVRPTELLTFVQRIGRRQHNSKHSLSNGSYNNSRGNSQIPNLTPLNNEQTNICLIDLSPPGSPTFTTRSSSDGVSIDSFGSDGNSNPSAFNSGSSTSQSGFEDDFDFFGGVSSQQVTSTQKFVGQGDPWKIFDNHDPFSPRPNSNKIREVGEACFFAFNSDESTKKKQMSSNVSSNMINKSMPTIIRAKPSKTQIKTIHQNGIKQKTTLPKSIENQNPPEVKIGEWGDDLPNDSSPPMPSIPPPPPPAEYLTDLEDGSMKNVQNPHGIAIYDLPATQEGDLELREGDIIMLISVVNDEWMEGRIGNRQGIFPVNFIDIKVPLPGTSSNIVNAMYTFKGETFEDLSFEEGARITVLSKISDDWLYGIYKGQKGQFPANYVDRIPGGLPNYS